MRDINLIPKEYFDKKKRIVRLFVGLMLTILALALMIYFYLAPRKNIQSLEKQIKNYDEVVVEYNILKNKLEQLEKSEETVRKRLQVLEEISSQEAKPTEIIELIKEAMPQDVFLTSLSYEWPDISLTCVASKASSVAEFYSELGKYEKFHKVVISPITKDDKGYNFTIQFSLTVESDKNEKD